MSAAAKRHISRIHELPCALCGAMPVEAHHLLEGRIKGRRCSDFCTIPLCESCHRDNHNGIHGAQAMLKIRKTTELELLGETIAKLYGEVR
jgi:hypothetical protein